MTFEILNLIYVSWMQFYFLNVIKLLSAVRWHNKIISRIHLGECFEQRVVRVRLNIEYFQRLENIFLMIMGCYKKSLLVYHLLNKSFLQTQQKNTQVTEIQFNYFSKTPIVHSTHQQIAILTVGFLVGLQCYNHSFVLCYLVEWWVPASFLIGHSFGVFPRGLSLSCILPISCFLIGSRGSHSIWAPCQTQEL